MMVKPFRKTTQKLMPSHWRSSPPGAYDLYPAFDLNGGRIEIGFEALANRLPSNGCVLCDGFEGVFWDEFRSRLEEALRRRGLPTRWVDVSQAYKSASQLDELTAPFLGGDDPVFGTRFPGSLLDFFDPDRLSGLGRIEGPGLTLFYGCGAALLRKEGFLVYVDLPKNELQFRARAGTASNLGLVPAPAQDAKAVYKRFYFVDWPALNRHKKSLAERVDLVVDLQRPEEPALMSGEDLRSGLREMAAHCFRVRPWFEPGPWGGQWCRRHIPELPEAPNYAWSFELIVPESGILFRDQDRLLEVSFDWLMFRHGREVLGNFADRFGDEFPIRMDFLDTVEGGNLSIQVHPRPNYIRSHFGERFTQDEAYYILDAAPGARVNLGFQNGVEPEAFRAALETSRRENTPWDAARYVRSVPSRRHDLFLIPHGTIHGSGPGNLVLEISATPYIFTFKLYDWLRLDLEGKPRPLNIERGMANLNFERSGPSVDAELLARPRPVRQGPGWVLEHLPTHRDHFYDVFRYRFEGEFSAQTEGSPQALNLVEGGPVLLQTARGREQRLNFAETMVVPAGAEGYRLRNLANTPATVVMACLKPL
jgi:mannose-6-phosphate isomerase class I